MTGEDPPPRTDFNIGIICALGKEGGEVAGIFDEKWDTNKIVNIDPDEQENMYTLGRIGSHCVVLAWVDEMGKLEASWAAKSIKKIFTNIKLMLVVGICGGVPRVKDKEILLGDVIISTAIHTYDWGKKVGGRYVSKKMFKPKGLVKNFLSKINSDWDDRTKLEFDCIDNIANDKYFPPAKYGGRIQYPRAENDKLYKSTYEHKHHSGCEKCIEKVCDDAMELSCAGLNCDQEQLEERQRLRAIVEGKEKPHPKIFFGTMASADTVVKDSAYRDQLAKEKDVIAFEMEGAGVCEVFESTVVIKGVCDYADSHKNKYWQTYAAVTAAACTRAFLDLMARNMSSTGRQIIEKAQEIKHELKDQAHDIKHGLKTVVSDIRPGRSLDPHSGPRPRSRSPMEWFKSLHGNNVPSISVSDTSQQHQQPPTSPSRDERITPGSCQQRHAYEPRENFHQSGLNGPSESELRRREDDWTGSGLRHGHTQSCQEYFPSSPQTEGPELVQYQQPNNFFGNPSPPRDTDSKTSHSASSIYQSGVPMSPASSNGLATPPATPPTTQEEFGYGRQPPAISPPPQRPGLYPQTTFGPAKGSVVRGIPQPVMGNSVMANDSIAESPKVVIQPTPPVETPKTVPPTGDKQSVSKMNAEQMNALFQACKDQKLDKIKEALKNHSLSSADVINDQGKNMMNVALGTSKVNTNKAKMVNTSAIIRFLHGKGADVNAKDAQGYAPLHICAKNMNSEAAVALLDAKANIDLPDKSGRTALYLAGIDVDPDPKFVQMLIGRRATLVGKKLPPLQARPRANQVSVRKLILGVGR